MIENSDFNIIHLRVRWKNNLFNFD